MINMLRKGIKFSIQRVYFPQSYFESRRYGKRISYKNSKVWVNFKTINCFRMLTATPAKLFRGTTSL